MARTEKLFVLPAKHELVGSQCIACQEELKAGDDVVICPRCRSPHHADCWRESAGCRRHGCPQVAVTIKSERTKTPGDAHLLKRSPKEKALLALSVVLVLGVLGFAMRPGPDPAEGRTKISIMLPGGIHETNYFDPFIEEFNDSQSDLYLALAVTPTVAYDQKLIVLLGARDAPDVFSLLEERYEVFAAQGGLLDLTPYLESEPELIKKFFPNGLDETKVNGSIYGIPHPERNEIYTIWALSPHPDTAWQVLVMLLEKISTDWPEELKGDITSEPWTIPMPDSLE